LRFVPLRRLQKRVATYLPEGTTFRVRVPSQRFYAHKALIHPQPAGLVSCRQRPWGCALQGLESGEPYILSDAATLLWLAEAATSGLGARRTLPAFHRSLNRWKAAPLMGFSSLGAVPSLSEAPDGAFPLMSFFVTPLRVSRRLFRVLLTARKVGLLRVRPPLTRFAPFVDPGIHGW